MLSGPEMKKRCVLMRKKVRQDHSALSSSGVTDIAKTEKTAYPQFVLT
jgi:hypothetical protein